MLAIELAPEEFLAAARLDSFDSQLDADFDVIAESITRAVPHSVNSDEIDRAIATEKARETELNNLWIVKNAFSEAKSLVDLGKFTAALSAIRKTRAKVPDYEINQLLARDLRNQLDTLEAEVLQQLEKLWAHDVKVVSRPEKVSLHLSSEFNERWELYRANDYFSQFSTAFLQLYNPLVAGQVLEVVEQDGHTIHIELGAPTSSAYDIIDKIQTFVLDFSSLVPPDLFSRCSDEYGAQLAKDVAKTLTQRAPLDKTAFTAYKSEVLGLKGLEELLSSVGWTHSKKLVQFADNFGDICDNERRATYLARLRVSLAGTFKPQSEDWDWDEDEDEEEEAQQADEPLAREQPSAIIQEYVQEHSGKIDSFISLFMALSQYYYRDQPIYLYTAAQELQAQVNGLPCTNLEGLQHYAFLQLDSVIQADSQIIDSILTGPLSTTKASAISQEIKNIAAKAAPAGSKIRTYILSSLVEGICVKTVGGILTKSDIAESESTRLAAFIKELQKLRAYFDDVEKQVPTWIKLQRLGDILSQNLMGIHAMFDNNMLVDFSSDELIALVEALFAESDMRDQLIYLWR